MSISRRKFSKKFKSKVVLESLKERESLKTTHRFGSFTNQNKNKRQVHFNAAETSINIARVCYRLQLPKKERAAFVKRINKQIVRKSTIFKMKLKTLNFCVFILCLAVGGGGCKKTEVIDNTQFVTKKCPCDHETKFYGSVIIDKILLFDASKTSLQLMKDLSFNENQSFFVCYFPNEESLICYDFFQPGWSSTSFVCNFPPFIKKWVIPATGIHISFLANEYELCNRIGGPSLENFYSNLVLISIKNLNN